MRSEGLDERLLRYIEGELSPAERQAVELELDQSPAAREVLAELARLYGDASIPVEPGAPASAAAPVPSGSLSDAAALDGPEPWAAQSMTVGRYHLESPVGSGSMGLVYLARDPMLDRMVALKLIHPQVHDQRGTMRLLREARALAQLSHPNVVEVYDTGEHEGAVFIAMELVRGTTLERWLHRERRSWRTIVDTFAAAGRGLVAAHAAGLVHRDFKPANVLVREDGRVVVTDFGLVRDAIEVIEPDDVDQVLPPREDLDAVTETGTILGTPAYMSPEQLSGRPVGAASDQFSFCVALYEALYGERPFHGRNLVELAESVRRGVVPPPQRHRAIPRALWRVLARGLRSEPQERWPSMTALVEAIVRIQKRRAPGPWLGGAGAVAALGIGVGVALLSSGAAVQPPPRPELELRQAAQAVADRVESLRTTLQEAEALRVDGRPLDARVRIGEVLDAARAQGLPAVEAEAQAALGRALAATGAIEDARAAHEAAYWLAQAHGHDRLMAEAATSIVSLLAEDPWWIEEAETWARHAQAVLDRMDPATRPPELELRVLASRARAHARAGDLAAAREQLARGREVTASTPAAREERARLEALALELDPPR